MASRGEVALSAAPAPGCAVRAMPWLVACAALDAFAAALLLVRAPLPAAFTAPVAVTVHAAAILLLHLAMRARASRGTLGAAAALAIPGAGIAVAAALLFTKGRERSPRRSAPRMRVSVSRSMHALRWLGRALCPCDALERGNDEQRRAALVALTRRADREAIALLRRASAAADPELALAAAIALDEIGKRFERDATPRRTGALRRAAG